MKVGFYMICVPVAAFENWNCHLFRAIRPRYLSLRSRTRLSETIEAMFRKMEICHCLFWYIFFSFAASIVCLSEDFVCKGLEHLFESWKHCYKILIHKHNKSSRLPFLLRRLNISNKTFRLIVKNESTGVYNIDPLCSCDEWRAFVDYQKTQLL